MPWSPLIVAVSSLLGAPQSDAPAVAVVDPPSLALTSQSLDDPDAVKVDDVFVIGRRGAARVPPEIELGEGEIDNLGAYDIGEVIARISGNLGLDRPPVLLINGRAVVNPGDFMGFPPDALVRVEVLPQQAAAIYGEEPSSRVLNLVLKPEFRSRDAFLRAARPTAGGTSSLAADGRQSEIHGNDTRQYGVQVSSDTALRAEERPGYIRDHPGSAGQTLRPAGEGVIANFSMTRSLGEWSSSLGATGRASTDRFASVIDGRVVETRSQTQSLSLTGGLSGDVLGWSTRLGLMGYASNVSQEGASDTRSRIFSMTADLTGNRPLRDLSAGPVMATLGARYAGSRSDNDTGSVDMRRTAQALDLRGNLALPLSRLTQDGPGLRWGDLSMMLGATRTGLLDAAGQGEGLDIGLNWAPMRKLRFNGQWSSSTGSPSATLRYNPIYYGPPTVVFDFRNGESVTVLPLLGGNPDLQPQTSRTLSLSASAGPFTLWSVQGRVGFHRASSINGYGAPPELTPAVEAAFPERFIRNASGRLIGVDQRMINLDSATVETLSSGLNLSIPSGQNGPGWQVSVNHSWQLSNVVVLRPGLPELDRLAGDGGGTPRQQASVQVDGRLGNWGLNAGARWQSAFRIRRDIGMDGPNDIERSAFAAVDLKISYLFERTAPAAQDGASSSGDGDIRVELQIDNLFDARPEATRGDGRPVPGYGRDDQDPLGRVVRLTLSRRF
ncbi:TonB-dependent receptor [Brevundimonas sp.]|uniref:TonB-dependent receptor n=1 Tax=Brevundimonas sp. TaxID=1871086 RepID=UPI003F7249D2